MATTESSSDALIAGGRPFPSNDPIEWPVDARPGDRESPLDLASALSNAAEKLLLRDIGSMRSEEAAALVRADLSILGLIPKGDDGARHHAAVAIAEIAQHHPAYRLELEKQDPEVEAEVDSAYGRELQRNLDKEARKASEYASVAPADAVQPGVDPTINWIGAWTPGVEGTQEIRAFVAEVDGGLGTMQYLGGLGISERGGEPRLQWDDESFDDRQSARDRASDLVTKWHRQDQLKEAAAAELPQFPVRGGMTSASDRSGQMYLVELNQPAVHLVSDEGRRVVVGQSDKGKALFMTRPDGHFDVVGSSQVEIQAFIDRRRLYPLEAAAVSKMATDNDIYQNVRVGGDKEPVEPAPLAVEITTSKGQRGYAVAALGPGGEPGVQFQWSRESVSEVFTSIGQLEMAGHAAHLRPASLGDAVELAQVTGLPGRPFEIDLGSEAVGRVGPWERIESVPDTYMRSNFESGMAEVKEDGIVNSVSGLANIERWSAEHGATAADKERLVTLDMEAARTRDGAAEVDVSERLAAIELQADAPRIGTTMPKPDWMETMQLLKAKDPESALKVYIPKAHAEYGGQLLMVTDTHVVQRIGKGIAIAHDLDRMSNRASIIADLDSARITRGMEMRVSYGQEKGSASFFSMDRAQASRMRGDLAAWAEKNISNERARAVFLKHVETTVRETPQSRIANERQRPPMSPPRDMQHSR